MAFSFPRHCVIGLLAAGLATSRGAEKPPADTAAQAQYGLLNEEQAAEQKKFWEVFQQAKTDDERTQAVVTFHPRPDKYSARFLELARKYPGSTGALDALVWIVTEGRTEPAMQSEVLGILSHDYLQSEKLDRVCSELSDVQTPEAQAFLRTVLEKSPHREVQASACLSLAQSIRTHDAQESEKLYQRAASQYADVVTYEQHTVGEAAQSALFEIQHLAVGQPAPDIVGRDVDGKEIKLSDYRGKVVVLDFWGRW